MFHGPRLVFGVTKGVGSCFLILRSRTRLRRYRGRRVPLFCLALSDWFSAVPRATGPVFMFCAPEHVLGGTEGAEPNFHVSRPPDSFSVVPRVSGLVFMFCALELNFGGTEGIVSRFYVLCSRTHFRRYRERRVPFSCFAPPDSFSTVHSVTPQK
jgi:hypothetical protein